MTWVAFYNAMRNGVSQRVGTITGRQGQKAASQPARTGGARSTSTNTSASSQQVKHRPDVTKWDFMVLDVSRFFT
jgi:hypothetical protein